MIRITALACAAMAISPSAWGGAFQLNLQGMRQVAMGGSGVAIPWDASTIFYNPGGLSRLEGIQVYANIFAAAPRVRYIETPSGNYKADVKPGVSVPFALYAGGPVKKGSRLSLGLGVYTPFGNHTDWGDDWRGRYIVQSAVFSSVFIQPTLSYRIDDVVSAGAGFVYGTGSMEIERGIPLQDAAGNDGQAVLKGNAQGVGFNAGVQVRATNKLQFGVAYRSGVRMKVKQGSASFSVPSSLAANFPNTFFTTEIPLPGVLTVGAGYKITKKLTVQGDVVFAQWKTYDSLKFDFKHTTEVLQGSSEPRDYKNTVAFRLGGHYHIAPAIAVMAGGAYDPSPAQDHLVAPDAVDADRMSLSCGVSYRPLPQLTVLAALNYTTTKKREAAYEPANFQGAYQIKTVIPGLAVSYDF